MVLRSSIDDVRITQQGFEKRVVSQDLQLWLSNVRSFLIFYPSIFMYSSSGGVRLASYITIVILQAPPVDRKFTLLARAGRQVSSLRAFICLSLLFLPFSLVIFIFYDSGAGDTTDNTT